MPELSARKRARVPTKKFGLPEKARSSEAKKETGNYPMPDKTHARSAKGRATAQYKAGNLTKTERDRIHSKADKVLAGKS